MYDIQYNGVAAKAYNLLVKERPNIPAPAMRYERIEVAGMNGSLIESDGTYEDIEIRIAFNYMSTPETWSDIYRAAKKWLLSAGLGELRLQDDLDYFYKVKHVTVEDNERTSLRIGNFAVVFLCEPFQYTISGKNEWRVSEVGYNHFELSHPSYVITGEGICTLNVNGNEVKVNVSEYVVLDTEKMLAYKGSELRNTMVAGAYEGLYLIPGENTIAFTEGFDVKVIPNWRCL